MDLIAKIGAQTSGLQTGLQNARAQVRKATADMGSEISKLGKAKFGLNQLGGNLMAALGINPQAIAEKLASAIMGGSAEAFAEVERMAKQREQRTENKMLSGMTSDQRLAYFERELKRVSAAFQPGRQKGENESEWQLRREKELAAIAEMEDRITQEKKQREAEVAKAENERKKALAEFVAAAKDWSKDLREQALSKMSEPERADALAAEAADARRAAEGDVAQAVRTQSPGLGNVNGAIALLDRVATATDAEVTEILAGLQQLGIGAATATELLKRFAAVGQMETDAREARAAAEEAAAKERIERQKKQTAEQQKNDAIMIGQAATTADKIRALEDIAIRDIEQANRVISDPGSTREERDQAREVANNSLRDVMSYFGGLIQQGSGFSFDDLRQIGGSVMGANYNVDPDREREMVLLESQARSLLEIQRNTDPSRVNLQRRFGGRPSR